MVNKIMLLAICFFSCGASSAVHAQIQVLHEQDTSWGSELGSGIAKGINQLANEKQQQKAKRRQARAYKELGLPPELASLPLEVQLEYLRSIAKSD